MATYVIGDNHFSHDNVRGGIIAYCNRPFKDVVEMDAAMIKRWNAVVNDKDSVWYLGDFALTSAQRTKEIIAQLNGCKHMIIGSHDKSVSWYKTNGFASATKTNICVRADNIFRPWLDPDYNRRFYIVFSHEPIEEFETACDDVDWLNIHAHVHNRYEEQKSVHHYCVSVEKIDYKPVSLESIVREHGLFLMRWAVAGRRRREGGRFL